MLNTCADLFVKNLKEKNFNFECGTDKDGDSVVEFPYQGKVAKMFFTGDEGQYLSMYLVYERVAEEKTTDVILACNDFNVKYKWVTAYVDSDNDLVFHDDAILAPENAADEAFELMVRMLKIVEDVKPEFMRAIYA